jgi:hypothetical protein
VPVSRTTKYTSSPRELGCHCHAAEAENSSFAGGKLLRETLS